LNLLLLLIFNAWGVAFPYFEKRGVVIEKKASNNQKEKKESKEEEK